MTTDSKTTINTLKTSVFFLLVLAAPACAKKEKEKIIEVDFWKSSRSSPTTPNQKKPPLKDDADAEKSNHTEFNQVDPAIPEPDAAPDAAPDATSDVAPPAGAPISPPSTTPTNKTAVKKESKQTLPTVIEPAIKTCDLLFNMRPNLVQVGAAIVCAENVLKKQTLPADRKITLERIFIFHAWIAQAYTEAPKKEEKVSKAAAQSAVNSAVSKFVPILMKEFPHSADAIYWDGVFFAFQPRIDEKYSLIPGKTAKATKEIIRRMEKARSLDRNVNLYGPNRVLAAIRKDAPGLFGGDSEKAVKLAEEAYKAVPHFALHHALYAQALNEDGQESSARAIAESFLSKPDSYFNSFPKEPWRFLASEVQEQKNIIRKMLKEM